MRRMIIATAALLLLTGCGEPPAPKVNQPLRHQYFIECLKNAPVPKSSTTKYQGWSDIVNSCENAAYWQATEQQP